MKNIAVILLLLVISVLLIAAIAIIIKIENQRNTSQTIERVIQVVEIPAELIYYSSSELNGEVQEIIEGGGTQDLLDFFDSYTNNAHVSSAIMQESLNQQVPITTAFALAWGESRFRPNAVNRNGGNTSDWGLFQLNDGHRQDWTREDFFNIQKNTHEGLAYFAYSLYEFDGDLTLSIAGYNKGVNSVKAGNDVPYLTLVHINNIIEYDRMLEVGLNQFINRWRNER